MKVLYIGVYRDSTGWGQAAIDYILSLDAAGVDVVPRALKLNNRKPNLPERLLELEAKSSRGSDVVIQNVLPHQMDYNGRMLNVGLFFTETSDFKASTWADRLNCMDALVVSNLQQVEAARKSGIKNMPVYVVPCATNIERFQRSYEPLDLLKPYRERGEFLFYFVGEMVRRKNLASLLKAFHLEFDPSEPVQLVLKTDRPGASPEESRKHIEAYCSEIKRGMKLHGGKIEHYKEEVVITDRLTEQGMMRLHAGCDCFVLPSYGEAWAIPAFDAMAMGKTPIVTACTGFLDYLSNNEGWLVRSHEEPVFGVNDTFEDLFVGSESWSAVDINHLRRCMRDAYEKESQRMEKATCGIARAYDFSYEAVGPQLKKALEHAQANERGEALDGAS
jgi:glycosyltransferase involved in cell wall biosynthesis